jgi:hypothetical protein
VRLSDPPEDEDWPGTITPMGHGPPSPLTQANGCSGCRSCENALAVCDRPAKDSERIGGAAGNGRPIETVPLPSPSATVPGRRSPSTTHAGLAGGAGLRRQERLRRCQRRCAAGRTWTRMSRYGWSVSSAAVAGSWAPVAGGKRGVCRGGRGRACQRHRVSRRNRGA